MPTPERSRDRRVNLVIHEIARERGALFDRLMEPHGLTRAQSWAIGALSRRGGMTQSELARVLNLTRVATGSLVARLEASGWVERTPDALDGRLRRVHLTEKCAPLKQLIDAAADEVNALSFAGFSDAERRQLIELLGRMRANLAESPGKAAPAPDAQAGAAPARQAGRRDPVR